MLCVVISTPKEFRPSATAGYPLTPYPSHCGNKKPQPDCDQPCPPQSHTELPISAHLAGQHPSGHPDRPDERGALRAWIVVDPAESRRAVVG